MTFNQTVWDALVFAANSATDEARRIQTRQALIDYAAQCDGTVNEILSYSRGSISFEFIPNPIPKY